ncbi:MAG: AMP-binding protein [Burkholderiales bacterium]|nr:AMP-binding protein [Burkholderiales bacterium]
MNKFWLNNYPSGVPEEITASKETIVSIFDKICDQFPNNKAYTCDSHSITFAEAKKYVENFAMGLSKIGIVKGDRVAIMLPNTIQYPIALFAILKLGAIVVNINPLYTPSEIEYLINNSGAKSIIVIDMMASKLDGLINKYNLNNIIVTKLPDFYSFAKRCLFNFVIKYVKKLNVNYGYDALNFRDLVNTEEKFVAKNDFTADDIAFIQYTGATTGKPKGAVLLHRNIVANVVQVHAWLRPQTQFTVNDIVISALPLYHIFSLTANLFTFSFLGAEIVMITNPRDSNSMLKTLKASNFTVLSALDTFFTHLLSNKEFTSYKFKNYRYGIAGGMSARASVLSKWREVTGVNIANCYGLTETSPALTMNPIDDKPFDGSVGFPISSTEIEIRDINTMQVLNINEVGIIFARGPQVMREYWNNPEQTKLNIDENGWFNTKDLGYLNEQGKLFLSGRQSEMIIVSGFNVYPAEVENNLNAIFEISASAVIGIPNELTGEAVIAFVVFKHGLSLTSEEIIKKCKNVMAGYKVPKQIHVLDDLPKTLVGKIDKVALTKIAIEHN